MVQRPHELLRGKAILLSLLILLSLSFSKLIDRVVASVNGEPILESELKIAQLYYNINDKRKVLDMLIDRYLIKQYLETRGLRLPEKYIDEVIEDIARRNYGSIEKLYEELKKFDLTLSDLKHFLRVELTFSAGLRDILIKEVKVSDIEVELELLKMGNIRYIREIKLLVVEKEKREEILRAVAKYGENLEKIAKTLGYPLEVLKVKKGDLVEPLDREVWRARIGELVIAEDENYIYFARILREIREVRGVSEDEIRRKILERKLKEYIEELLSELRENSVIEIFL